MSGSLRNSIKFIGHASTLIEIDEKQILVDPVFDSKLLGFIPRNQELGIRPEELSDIDAVLITHIHHDHLDLSTYKYLSLDLPVIIPQKTKKYVEKFVYQKLEGLQPKERISHKDLIITATKSKHRSGRFLSIRNSQSLNYIIEGKDKTIFVGSDSGYGPQYKDIGDQFKIDIALLPIGHTGLHFNSKRNFLSGTDAAQAAEDLKCQIVIPISWGSFHLPWKKKNSYLENFKEAMKDKDLEEKMIILHPGENFDF